ncbi:MAG: ABC transporter permease [Deinococcales bacterium]
MAFLLSRVVQSVVVLWLVGSLTFLALQVVGDPIALLVAEDATVQERQRLREAFGLDQPWWVQYWLFIQNAATGNLGNSFYSARSAFGLLLERLPATLSLVVLGLSLGLVFGVPLGVIAAVRVGSSFDRFIQHLSALLIAAPTFWLGMILIQLFAVEWRILPSQGSGTLWHLLLPALTLALSRMGVYIQMVRLQLLEVLGLDFVRTARAKGLRESVVVYRHALRNALIPLVTVLGLQVSGLLSGAVVIESLFAYPGMNRVALEALNRLDMPVILAFVLLSAFVYSVVHFVVDLMYVALDPRIVYV